MGKVTWKRYGADFKAKVALEAIKGEQTVAELAAKYSIHPTMITTWKKQAIEGMSSTFSNKRGGNQRCGGGTPACQDRATGRGTGFFVESLQSMSIERRRQLVEPSHPVLSIARQCALVSISRSSFYYQPRGETPLNLALMRLIDEVFLDCPFYGARQMARHLRRLGHAVGRKRVSRLMAKMGLTAIYQKPRTSDPHPDHPTYPYLLKGLEITRPNHAWCTDITYSPMRRGFLYLVAIMDWATRKVLSWWLSNTMEADFCIEALEEALKRFGKAEIFNTDQGSQLTSPRFTGVLLDAKVQISMDGRGRWMDNVFIERLWRSVKYECVYLHAFETGSDLRAGLNRWMAYDNTRRPQSALVGQTPDEAYHQITPSPCPGHAPDRVMNAALAA